MARKCDLYDCCTLRMFYETTGRSPEILKKYCKGTFKKCARYKLEVMEGRGARPKPKVRKICKKSKRKK